ncbi:LysR family transcriptional regulator [Pseudoalteromonas spongiae]|uniref:LysR family transcriptional regulator n=1 Tax=Pseudoalteromonas spongiae TaxID=298657 RepID=UPI0003918E1A|nr:LysR family transcriptional regulator [Pseudoalteromonas spongiae]
MNKLRCMHLFARLADLGSFAAVAEELGVTPSMVSKEIQKLEMTLDARLLHRSTRKIQLTHIGEGYLNRCREILAQVHDADAYVQQMQNSVKGKLRINLPMALGLTDLNAVLSDFMSAYPEVELDIHLGDEALDLLEHGFDLGFRASSTVFDSNYIGKPLTKFTYHVCASPNYLAKHGDVTTPQSLKTHNCFIYSYFKGGNKWPINEGVTVTGNLKVNSTLYMKDVIVAGLGIGFLPSFVAKPAFKKGQLVEVLSNCSKPDLILYALYPNRKHTPPILAKCIEFIADWFSKKP